MTKTRAKVIPGRCDVLSNADTLEKMCASLALRTESGRNTMKDMEDLRNGH